MARNYSNTAVSTTLTSGVNSSVTSIPVAGVSGYPTPPFTAILEPGTASEEVVEVTAVVGTTFTATRGIDGTPAQTHGLGSAVVHGVSARDFSEPNVHVTATTSVHGITNTASLVTLTGSQTLTNKTLTSPVISGGTFSGLTLSSPTIANFANAQHTHEDAASGGLVGGGGGSEGFGVAYKRGGGFQNLTITSDVIAGAMPIAFTSLTHSIGNTTWTTATSDKRIVLPSDIATGYWHISAGFNVVAPADAVSLLSIHHQDLGDIAYSTDSADWVGVTNVRYHSASTDFSSSAGKWIEVRAGGESGTGEYSISQAYVALHRIA